MIFIGCKVQNCCGIETGIVTPCKCSVLNLSGDEFPPLPVSFCGGTNHPKTSVA